MSRAVTVLFTVGALSFLGAADAGLTAPPGGDEQKAFNEGVAQASAGKHRDSCRSLSAFLLKYPGSAFKREAQLQRSSSCLSGGTDDDRKRALDELTQLSDAGPDDWVRAQALVALSGRVSSRAPAALDRLIALAKGGGPNAGDASALAVALGSAAISNGYAADADARAARLLALDLSEDQKAQVRVTYAQVLLKDPKRVAEAEAMLVELGKGRPKWAETAWMRLSELAQGRGDFPRAIEFLDRVASQGGTYASSARAAKASILAPQLSVSVAYVELPGAKAEATIEFRNLGQAQLTLFRVDPASFDPKVYFNGEDEGGMAHASRKKTVIKSWAVELKERAPYAPSTAQVLVDPPGPGVYVLEAAAGDKLSQAMLHVTPYAALVKVAPAEVLVWLADAVTGQAVGGGRALALVETTQDEKTRTSRVEGPCDASGLCRLPLPRQQGSRVAVWVGKGSAWTYADASSSWWEADEPERRVYVMTDRPLYKPGEKVAVKLFQRSRGGGVSRPLPGKPVRVILSSPAGDEVDRRVVRPNAFGTASYQVALKKDAALGDYAFTVENPNEKEDVSLQQGGGGFAVEEYKPPEFVVDVVPVGSPKAGEAVKVKISASLYAGGPVAFAQGRALVNSYSFSHSFGAWGDEPDVEGLPWFGAAGLSMKGGYGLGDLGPGAGYPVGRSGRKLQPTPCFNWSRRTIDFRTGEDGTVELEVEPACATAPEHTVDVSVLVTDLSRREVRGAGAVNLSRTPWYVDVRTDRFLYRPGEPIKVTLRAEDANGRPASPSLQVRLVRVGAEASAEVLRKDVALVAGAAELSLDADALGPVRVEVREKGADPAEEGELVSADAWLTNDARPLVPPWDGLFLITDQRPVRAGTVLRALVVAPHAGGHALVTVEGGQVHLAKVVELKGRARMVELPMTGAMTPNVALAVSRFERLEHLTAWQELRVSGGEAPIEVMVRPAAPTALPGSAMPVEVKLAGAPAGTSAEVAFTAVDAATFAIAPEQTDLVSFFTRAYQESHVQTLSSVDALAFRPLPEEPPPAQPLPEVDRPAYLDASQTGPSGSASMISRAMGAKKDTMGGASRVDDLAGVGAGGGPAAGKARDDGLGGAVGQPAPVRVRSRFTSSAGWAPELRGALGGSATAQARFSDSLTRWKLTAYAVTAAGHLGVGSAVVRTELPVMVRLQGPRFFTERDEVVLSAVVTSRLAKASVVDVNLEVPGLKALGPTSRRVTVLPGRDVRVDVRYAVTAAGKQRFKATARAGGAADAMEWTLPSVLHGAAKREAFAGPLADRFAFDVTLPDKRNPKGTKLSLTVSPTLVGVMLDALPFLAEYPYGCVEQTLSRFVPAVAAARVVNKLGLSSPRVPKDLAQMVDAGLKRLVGFQHRDGGWGWWETDDTDPRMTAYVVFGLALAREAGVKVDPAVIDRGRAWLLARPAASFEPEQLAFAAFALAASGEAPKKLLDAAFEGRGRASDVGKAFTALALATAKDPRAKASLDGMGGLVEAVSLGVKSGRVADVWDSCAGIEATSLTLMAVNRRDAADPLVGTLTDFLVLRRKGERWSTTLDTAFAVYALADVAVLARQRLADGSVSVRVNGKEAGKAAYRAGGAEGVAISLGDAAFKLGANHVEVLHQGAPAGHWAALFDVVDVAENVKAQPNAAVELKRSYAVLGRPGGEKAFAELEYGMPVESGERIRVDLEVNVTKALEYVLVEDLKPAGLEPVAQRSGEVCSYACTHAELRPDRVAFFARGLAVGKHRFSYELRAEVPGRFHGLPARVEAMYAPEVQASSDEMRVEVRDAPKPADDGVAKH